MEASKNNQTRSTTLSHHPYILCRFATTKQIFLVFVNFFVQRRDFMEAVGWVVVGVYIVHLDVYGEWVLLWVAAM